MKSTAKFFFNIKKTLILINYPEYRSRFTIKHNSLVNLTVILEILPSL